MFTFQNLIRVLTAKIVIFCCVTLFGTIPVSAQQSVQVVTTTTDLASVVEMVGGDHVSVTALNPASNDPHYQSARPSYVSRLSNADLFVKNGLDLEVGWVPELMREARNQSIRPGGKGYVNAAEGINPIEVPGPDVTRSQGHVHPRGNSHYTLDPIRTKQVAYNVVRALSKVDPTNRQTYVDQLKAYYKTVDRRVQDVVEQFEPHQGRGVISYHKQWGYLITRLGLQRVDTIEPMPGQPPSASRMAELIQSYDSNSVLAVLSAPWQDRRVSENVAEGIGVESITGCAAVGQCETQNVIELFEENAKRILKAIEAVHS